MFRLIGVGVPCLALLSAASCGVGGSNQSTTSLSDADVATDPIDGAAPKDGAGLDGLDGGDASVAPIAEWIVAYFAGTASTGPGGLSGPVGLQSVAQDVALFSNGDLAVAGGEELNAGGQSGIVWDDGIYVFAGTTGGLRWKDAARSRSDRLVPADPVLAGIDAQDHLYVAGRWQLAKATSSGARVWLSSPLQSGHPLDTKIRTLGGIAGTNRCKSAIVDDTGTSVMTGFVADSAWHPNSWAIAQQITSSGTLGWTTQEAGLNPTVRPIVDGASIVIFAEDPRATAPSGVAMWRIDRATGASSSIGIARPAGVPAGVTDTWWWTPFASMRLPDGSYALTVRGYEGDAERWWIWRVSNAGVSLGAVALAQDEYAAALTATPEGLVVLGSRGAYPKTPLALRFDATLHALGQRSFASALPTGHGAWGGGATRDGVTALVGTFQPVGQSASVVALLARTQFLPSP